MADDAVVLPNSAPKVAGKEAVRAACEGQLESDMTFGSLARTVERAWGGGGLVCSVGRHAMSAKVLGIPRPVAD